MAENFDWNAAELEYVTTNISLEKLAESIGCSPTTVKKYAAKGGWAAKRKEYKQKVVRKATGKTATKASSVLRKAWGAAGKFVDIIDREADRITAMQAMSFQLLKRGEKLAEEGDEAEAQELAQVGQELMAVSVSAKDMAQLSGALDKLTDTIRKAADLPTKAEREAMKNAAERLALQKQIAQADNGDKTVTIRMEGVDGFCE